MSDAPVWVQIVVIVIGLVCLVGSIWAARTHKRSHGDWDYRDDL
jgi:protein-S-isoprenylcysteine O-methyltransferase Ste14